MLLPNDAAGPFSAAWGGLLRADGYLAVGPAHREERGAGRGELDGAEAGVLEGPGADGDVAGGGAVHDRDGDAADQHAGPAAEAIRHREQVPAGSAEGDQRAPDIRPRSAADSEQRSIEEGQRAGVAKADQIAGNVQDAAARDIDER